LRLWVVDRSASGAGWQAAAGLLRPGDLLLFNKADLPAGEDGRAVRGVAEAMQALELSATGVGGLDALWSALGERVQSLGGGDFPAVTRLRHRRHLQDAALALRRGELALVRSPELAAEDLRHAASALGRIAGRIDPEEVLGEVFASFCIGK
jgi:tRNA modification GTPase